MKFEFEQQQKTNKSWTAGKAETGVLNKTNVDNQWH